jgi:hypothetical protein
MNEEPLVVVTNLAARDTEHHVREKTGKGMLAALPYSMIH